MDLSLKNYIKPFLMLYGLAILVKKLMIFGPWTTPK